MSDVIFPDPSAETAEFLAGITGERYHVFLEKMTLIGKFLYETNEKINLTALPPEAFWCKHAADSLSIVKALPEITSGRKHLCDLGCGAGFPSLVLACAFPELEVVSVDSTGKKIAFVAEAAQKAGLTNLKAVHARGNELARKEPYRGGFDVVTARAVASADTLVKEGSGFLKKNGVMAVYRTPSQLAEEKEYLRKNKKITWKETELFELPEGAGSRLFLLIGK